MVDDRADHSREWRLYHKVRKASAVRLSRTVRPNPQGPGRVHAHVTCHDRGSCPLGRVRPVREALGRRCRRNRNSDEGFRSRLVCPAARCADVRRQRISWMNGLRQRRRHVDEVNVMINGKMHYLSNVIQFAEPFMFVRPEHRRSIIADYRCFGFRQTESIPA